MLHGICACSQARHQLMQSVTAHTLVAQVVRGNRRQEPAVLQACQSLEQLLAEDQYLSTRVDKITIDSRQKAAYSIHRQANSALNLVQQGLKLPLKFLLKGLPNMYFARCFMSE